MEPVTCLIVDDEPPAREVLRRYVKRLPMLELAGECGNALQAMGMLKQRRIDVLFLDIHMPAVTGIDLIKTMSSLPRIILTTAFEQYALQAFDLDVVDYLLKPIAFERFLKAVMKALPFAFEGMTGARLPPAAEKDVALPFLYIRAERKTIKVLLEEILYIESLGDYVKIRTKHGDIVSKYSMTLMEGMLPERRFIRIHRSFIAAVDKICSYTQEHLEVDKVQLPIGKLYRLQVLKILGGE